MESDSKSEVESGVGVDSLQTTSGLCWNSQFMPKITSQEGSRSVITNITSVRSMAESRMESQTASVTQTEVVPFMKTTSWGVTGVFGRRKREANLVSVMVLFRRSVLR